MAQRKEYSIVDVIDFVTSGDISELSDLSDDEMSPMKVLILFLEMHWIPISTTRIMMSIHLMTTAATMMMMIM